MVVVLSGVGVGVGGGSVGVGGLGLDELVGDDAGSGLAGVLSVDGSGSGLAGVLSVDGSGSPLVAVLGDSVGDGSVLSDGAGVALGDELGVDVVAGAGGGAEPEDRDDLVPRSRRAGR